MRKMTKLAAIFNWIITFLSAAMVIILVAAWYIGVGNIEGEDLGFALAGVVVLTLGLYGAVIFVPIGLILGVPKAILFTVSAKKGKRLFGKYILATLEKLVWAVFFVFAAIFVFDFPVLISYIVGAVAVLMACLNVASCVFDWISLKEFKAQPAQAVAQPVQEVQPEEVAVEPDQIA